MGTRADFYIKSEAEQLVWLGSIAWDGHPCSISTEVLTAASGDEYKAALSLWLEQRDDSTLPEDGWPWPWNDSRTTDYSYCFDGKEVKGSAWGHSWFDPTRPEPDFDGNEAKMTGVFPDMSAIKKVRMDKGSGLTFI